MCDGEKGYPRPKFFWDLSTFVSKVGKILTVKGIFYSGPKLFLNFSLTIFKFEILSDITWSHAIFGTIFGKIGACFRQNGCMQLGGCP